MKRIGVRRLFSLSLRRDRWESEVEEEIRTHLTIRAERLVALGMSPHAAREEAVRRFGPLDEARERMIEAANHREEYMRRRETFAELRQDLSFAFRTLSRNRGWAAVAVVTLALGLAATTAVWSAASTLLLHPLPYAHANRIALVNLMPTTGNTTGWQIAVTAPTRLIRAWRDNNRSFESLEPFSYAERQVGVGVDTVDLPSTRILATFASFADKVPVRGRNFTEAEVAAKEPVALVSEAFWHTRLGSDPAVIGRTIAVNNRPHRIIGVMPNSLQAPNIGAAPSQLWLPLDLSAENASYRLIGRLREGVSVAAATRDLDSVTARSGVYPTAAALQFAAAVTPPGRTVSFHESLRMLAAAVMLVLLVAAGNVTHLLLARSVGRQREIAIRTALGASRRRITRQLMTETFVLTMLGCASGAALGYAALKGIVAFRPTSLAELELARLDGPAMALVLSTSALCGVLFGLIAAATHSRRSVGESLRAGVVSSFSRRGERFRSMLVVCEMALSAMLLVGAALLTRTVMEMQRSDVGFDPANLYGIPVQFAPSTAEGARASAVQTLIERIRAIPGVRSATLSDALPSHRNFSIGALQIEGAPPPPAGTSSFIDVASIAPDYFGVIGARIVEGRTVEPARGGAREVVVNEGFARRQWKPGEAVGKKLRVVNNGGGDWLTIVGVVRDVSTSGPTSDKSAPYLYSALPEAYSPGQGVILRTDGNPATIAAAVAATRAYTRSSRVAELSAERILTGTLAGPRFIMTLMAIFSALALVLAAIGLYGMMSYAVAQRTREIGIRIALGATREAIARAVVGRGAILGITGAVVGLTLAFWATRIIEGSLFGVSRLDTASFAIGGAGLVLISVAACLVPTWRAVRVDPMTSIRAD
jgi:putative ABC transport system permease protein